MAVTTNNVYNKYLDQVDNTPRYSAMSVICDSYIENDPHFISEDDAALAQISAGLDVKVNTGSITNADLADYEEGARRAGFNAGFKAAIAYIHLLNKIN